MFILSSMSLRIHKQFSRQQNFIRQQFVKKILACNLIFLFSLFKFIPLSPSLLLSPNQRKEATTPHVARTHKNAQRIIEFGKEFQPSFYQSLCILILQLILHLLYIFTKCYSHLLSVLCMMTPIGLRNPYNVTNELFTTCF